MATTIKLKNGSGAPSASDLVQGEPALDLTNNRLYSENGSGSVVEIGTNPTSLSINGTAITATAAELNILDGVTSTAAELNILDGVTSTTAELNILDGVTATTAELNFVDGVTSNIQTQLDAKGTGTVSSLSDLSVTATATELNIMDGVTATTAELNIMDGVTSTAAELNILDGVTSTAAELNILDGVTSTTAELNILDGVTSTTAELNILDGVTSTTAELNILDGVTSTAAELNILDGVTATASELNVLDGVTAFLDEDNFASNSATAIPSQQSVKAYVDANAGSGSGLSNVVEDTTPQLGGGLDVNGQDIVSVSNGNITLTPNGSGVVRLDGNVDIQSGEIVLKNSGSVSNIKFYCESSNAHYTQLQSSAHSAYGGNVTLTLPPATDTLVGRATTDTLTNKTLTSPDVNTPDIDGGTIDGTVIGGSTAAAGTFTTFTSNGIDDNADAVAITIDSSENVGIGTTSASTVLDVEGVWVNDQGLLALNATSGQYSGLTIQHSGTAKGYLYYDNTNDFFNVYTTGVLRLIGGGNVNIGGQAGNYTDARLTARNNGNAIEWGHTNTAGYGSTLGANVNSGAPFIGLSCGAGTNANTFRTYGLKGSLITTDNAGAMVFSRVETATADNQTPAESMRISSSGNIGIGSSNPTNKLVLETSADEQQFVQCKNDDTNSFFGSRADNVTAIESNAATVFTSGSSFTERMRLTSGGYLLVGTTTIGGDGISLLPRYSGSSTTSQIRFNRADSSLTGTVLNFMDAGYIVGHVSHTGTSTTYGTTSDQRRKKNIVDAPAGNIDDIRVRSFDWKVDGTHQKYGVIAQELIAVAPEAVSVGDDDDKTMTVDHAKLIPMMIKEIQDLKAEVAALKGE